MRLDGHPYHRKNHGSLDPSTQVDAYSVPREEMKVGAGWSHRLNHLVSCMQRSCRKWRFQLKQRNKWMRGPRWRQRNKWMRGPRWRCEEPARTATPAYPQGHGAGQGRQATGHFRILNMNIGSARIILMLNHHCLWPILARERSCLEGIVERATPVK